MTHLAFDESIVWLGCIACREDVNATQGFAVPVRMYVAALERLECGEVIATYDILTREAA